MIRTIGRPAAVAAIALGFAASLAAADVSPRSKIAGVTVYPDRATVTREASLALPAGETTVVLSSLPFNLIPASLRATGRGTAPVRILGMESAAETLDAALRPEVRELQAAIEAKEREAQAARDRIGAVELQESFLVSVVATSGPAASRDAAAGRPDPAAWDRVLEFLGTKTAAFRAAKLEAAAALKTREAELAALKERLAALHPGRATQTRVVRVHLDAPRPGDFTLSVAYTVPNARWTPLYTLRAMPETKEIELGLSGTVAQWSGENWEGVPASLSTASPALAAEPPALAPWILEIFRQRPMMQRAKAMKDEAEGAVGGVLAEAPASMPAPPPPVEATAAVAEVLESGLHLDFKVPAALNVPSDANPHRVPIDGRNVAATFDYVTAPKTREAAYLRATVVNTLPYPLLPGPADLFIGQDFVGSNPLPAVAAGEEAKMFFGQDDQVKVTREQVRRERSQSGLLSKSEELALGYRITVRNFRKAPVRIDVLDQIPVSQDEKIEVQDVTMTPAPSKKGEDGLLTWTLELAPGEKKEIALGFRVKFPRDAPIRGI